MKKVIAAALSIAVVTLAGCGTKVDRAKTKKVVGEQLKNDGALNAADQTCVVNAIDKYSDKQLLALDKELKASNGAAATSEIGKQYQGDIGNCAKGTLKDEITKQAKANGLVDSDLDCALKAVDKYSGSDVIALLKDSKADIPAESEVGKKFEGELTNCARGTVKQSVLDGLKTEFPNMTAVQADCISGVIDKLSADEFSKLLGAGDAAGAAFGEELAKQCLV
jgi:uncharacterized protein YdbL (DUF1318 family)